MDNQYMTMQSIIDELHKLESLYNNGETRKCYYQIREIEKLIFEYRSQLTVAPGGRMKYFDTCTSLFFMDVAEYLNKYKDTHKDELQYTDYYQFHHSNRLYVRTTNYRIEKSINMKGMSSLINIPKKVIFSILDIEGETVLLEDDYKKFLDIRKNNPEYFLPYIQDIISCMHQVCKRTRKEGN